jgi:peptidoglycan-associated lipoprotein
MNLLLTFFNRNFNEKLTEGKNMKMMKLIYPLALAVALAATSCKHDAGKVTPLPGENGGAIGGDTGGGTLPGGGTMPPDNGAQTQPGGGPTASLDEFENMTMDRAALANDTVHFAYDSSIVKKSESSNLQAVASALSSDPSTKLLIEGHCDERGTEEYNRSLGERRALALREALAKLGVDPSRVRTISYGKDRPADPGHDESAWSKNRRGEFVLLHPKSQS